MDRLIRFCVGGVFGCAVGLVAGAIIGFGLVLATGICGLTIIGAGVGFVVGGAIGSLIGISR